MKDFLKYTLATISGLIITGIIALFLGLSIVSGIIYSAVSKPTASLSSHSVLVINLKGSITEQKNENPFESFFGEEQQNISLKEVLTAIRIAKTADEIEGIHLEAGTSLSGTPAAFQEIRHALQDFKESGKFITAYADTYSQGNYYLCSIADHVILNPQGSVAWTGLMSETIFYKELLEKLGIEVEVFKVGTFKSAVEPYTSTQMSKANREQTEAFLQSIWQQIVSDVSASRSVSVDSLNLLADELIMLAPTEKLVRDGLVDTLLYREEANKFVYSLGNPEIIPLKSISPQDLCNAKSDQTKSEDSGIIAVYYLEGNIDDSSTNEYEGIHAPIVCDKLSQLAEDENIRAVVLRVNSPGGSAFGSEQIWHEVCKLKQQKPVIVSMGGYAASGGYYISCAADTIVAESTTLTGSIGIFGMFPRFKGLAEKIGLQTDRVKTNRFSEINSLTEPLAPEAKKQIQGYINRGYDLFVNRCAEGRQLSPDSIRKIAEGRVWTGEVAKEIGLVDVLGDLTHAIEIAADKAQLTDYYITSYPQEKDWLTRMLEQQWKGLTEIALKETIGESYETIRFMKNIREQHPLQTRLPFELYLNL